jgi:hypothetical protein
LSSTRQANQHRITPAAESAGQPCNRVFERYTAGRLPGRFRQGCQLVTRTQERYAGIRARLDACRSQAAISRDTGLTAKAVRRFARAESVDEFSSRP